MILYVTNDKMPLSRYPDISTSPRREEPCKLFTSIFLISSRLLIIQIDIENKIKK